MFSSDESTCKIHKLLRRINLQLLLIVKKAGTNNPGVPTGPRLSGLAITYRAIEEVSGCREL